MNFLPNCFRVGRDPTPMFEMKRKATRNALRFVVVTFAFVCSASAVEGDEAAPFREVRAEFNGFGKGLAAVYARTGKLRTLRKEPSRHEPEKVVSVQSSSLPGIKVELRRLADLPDLPLIDRLTITKNEFWLLANRRIGTSTPIDILSWLGSPDEKRGSSLIYRASAESDEDTFTFHFHGDRLTSVEWEWYFD
jgi:hypothetical protein